MIRSNVIGVFSSRALRAREAAEPDEPGCLRKGTGRSYDNEWAMVWTLRDGKVAGWQIYEDTLREFAVHRT